MNVLVLNAGSSNVARSGAVLDLERNQGTVGRQAAIGAVGARIGAFVIPTDEEIVIARDTVACLEGRG